MANYPFTANIKWDMRNECTRLFTVHEQIVERGFPLDRDDVLRATVPENVRGHLSALSDLGVRIYVSHMMHAIIEPHDSIDRGMLLVMSMRETVPYAWDIQANSHQAAQVFGDYKTRHNAGRLPFDMSVLSEDKRVKFDKWLGEALLQRRRCEVARDLAIEFLNKHCNTTGELLTRWPGLRVIFKRLRHPWPERVLDAPSRHMSRWNWSSGSTATFDWYVKNERKMIAADALLQAAAMFDANRHGDENSDLAPVTAHILAWDKDAVDDCQR